MFILLLQILKYLQKPKLYMANWFLIIDVQFFSLNCGFIKFVYMPNKDDEKLKCENKTGRVVWKLFLGVLFCTMAGTGDI